MRAALGGGIIAIVYRKADKATATPAEVEVRPAESDDLPAIIALDAEATGLGKPGYWKDRFAWYAGGQRNRYFLIAEDRGEPVGFIVGEVRAWEFGSPPSGWVFAIDVKAEARLHGLGTVLFDALCARFRKAGAKHVRTMLARDAQVLMSFFRGQGMMAGPFIQLEKRLAP
ncbi:MAG TPA: GNAT family N-acetyltransferase [Anaeromyxobacteraceae bacterium]